jgi:hypothetical protein
MAFEVHKMGKLADQLEERASEWVLYEIQQTYGVESTEELTREQIDEIQEFRDADGWIEGYVRKLII